MTNKPKRKPHYPIAPTKVIHLTKPLKLTAVALVVWTIFTSLMTWMVIEWSVGLRQCTVDYHPAALEKPHIFNKHRIDTNNRLAKYIHTTFKIDKIEAGKIVYWAEVQARTNSPKEITLPLVLGVIAAESSFQKLAVSEGNANGLMQLTKSSGRNTSHNIYENIVNGVEHLSDYYQQLGSIEAAVQAYNIGIGAYKRGNKAKDYLQKVMQYKQEFELLVG